MKNRGRSVVDCRGQMLDMKVNRGALSRERVFGRGESRSIPSPGSSLKWTDFDFEIKN